MSDDGISLEPLFNQSSQGSGTSRRVGFIPIDTVGATSHRTPITVTSIAQQITIAVGKRTIEFQNTGTKIIYFGGTGVTSSNGIKLFPNQSRLFSNVKDTFSIFVVTAVAETAELRILEYA